ncbi:uncharacterized protein PRCAT00000363001 [Priceomyces carsonii]|uniref:uncharacterized protein n=1 Tax=Priceomyces carsonii TaxID=28549 RepID=UPI002ED979E1|nr:unnamed protein product [Priceomyces carsonii]
MSLRSKSIRARHDQISEEDNKKGKEKLKWTLRPLSGSIFFLLFLYRLFNSLTIKTFFQADEYYQSLEPAHKNCYGYGYLTWEWREGLRSSIHPIIYSLGYHMLSSFSDNPEAVIIAPKVIGALQATIAEYYLYRFVQSVSKNECLSKLTLAFSLVSPFNWYFITRSFSNNLEMVFTVIGLTYWPWNFVVNKYLFLSCGFAFFSCIIRPTNGLIWIYLGSYLLWKNYLLYRNLSVIFMALTYLEIELLLVLLISGLLDRAFYNRWTFPLYNFLEFNIFRNLSIFYGTAPWHFYILQAFPLILLTYLPFFIHSIIVLKCFKHVLGQMVAFVVLGFSLVGHKEIRFIYPLHPVLLYFSACSVNYLASRLNLHKLVLPVVFLNIAIAFFFTQVHERGVIDVVHYLRLTPSVESFGLLTPCHSTPWQSHLHNITFSQNSWFITCEPPLHLQTSSAGAIKSYKDESDHFYDNPTKFLHENFPSFDDQDGNSKYQWPSHLVFFEPLEETMSVFFKDSPYEECTRFFNSFFHWDDRRKGDVIVYCNTSFI